MIEGQGEVEFSPELIAREAEAQGFDLHDLEAGTYLYDLANIGHVADRWGMDYWWACPASYVRFNPDPAVGVAHAAVDAAEWIRAGAPHMALGGAMPSLRMATLIQQCLTYWQIEEAEMKAKAYKDATDNH